MRYCVDLWNAHDPSQIPALISNERNWPRLTARRQLKCVTTYLEGFVRNPQLFRFFQFFGPNMTAALRAFRAEFCGILIG